MNISWEETIFIYKTSIALKQFFHFLIGVVVVVLLLNIFQQRYKFRLFVRIFRFSEYIIQFAGVVLQVIHFPFVYVIVEMNQLKLRRSDSVMPLYRMFCRVLRSEEHTSELQSRQY